MRHRRMTPGLTEDSFSDGDRHHGPNTVPKVFADSLVKHSTSQLEVATGMADEAPDAETA